MEAWRVFGTWDVERREDDTVVVLHPFRRWFNLEERRDYAEMELPAFTQEVTAAHEARVAANGGRIGADASLPMLATDANQLRQFFSDPAVGGYAPGAPTPAQPPPPCGLAVPDQGANPGLMRDCQTLLAAKDALAGTATLNWSVDTTIASWDGVTTGGTPTRVTKVELPSESLSGTIPAALGSLFELTHLDLSANSLTGDIPSELGWLFNLEEIRLSGNSLTGCIPVALEDVAVNDLSSLNLLYCQPPAPASTPAPTYLTEEIPPCTPAPGSSVDPCEPGAEGALIPDSDGLILFEPLLHVAHILNGSPTAPISTTHVVLRGTYLPGTVRCTSGHRIRFPSYVGYDFDALSIYCFADVRVNAYLLGTGPPTLTVIVEADVYAFDGGVDDDDYGLEQLESRRSAYERALAEGGRFEYDLPLHLVGNRLPHRGVATGPPGGIGGREAVLFIRPSASLSMEAWRVFGTWDVERREDDTVVVLHPFRRWFNLEERRNYAEMELPTFTQEVTAAHEARVAANGGRIGADASLPMLATDANQLRQFFSDPAVGGYAPGAPTPAQPPPPCGLAVPNQGANPGLMRDCQTLLAAKDALAGTATLNWSVDTTIASWDGVTTGGTPSRVTKVELPSESLTGTIPAALGSLFELTHLDLSANSLTGDIPRELGWLFNLEEIRLSGNSLTGCIPVALEDVAVNDLSSLNLLYCQPPAPGSLAAGTIGETSAALTWGAVANTSTYRVEYRPAGPGAWTVDDDTLTGAIHTVDGLLCDRAYEFRVSAYGSGTTYAAAWSEPAAVLTASTKGCAPPVFAATSTPSGS